MIDFVKKTNPTLKYEYNKKKSKNLKYFFSFKIFIRKNIIIIFIIIHNVLNIPKILQ